MKRVRAILAVVALWSLAGAPAAGSGDSARTGCSSPDRTSEPVVEDAWTTAPEPALPASPAAPHAPLPLFTEGEGSGEGEPEGESGATRAKGVLRHVVPLGTALLLLGWTTSRPGTLRARVKLCVLAGLAALAVVNYLDLGDRRDRPYVNGWEFFHYYLGSKYLPELGHTRLYEAVLVADEETGLQFDHEKGAIRNLVTGGGIRVEDALAQRDSVMARFSPERWSEFEGDVLWFKGYLSPYQWDRIFHDKGYNATPVWSMAVTPLTNAVPTSSPHGLLALSLLDPLLLALALLAVWRTFDLRTSLLMVVLVGTHMITSHSHMKGALLRTDWVVSLVLAVCALKSGRPAAGGAFAALAACSRVFPVLFAVGMFARLVLFEVGKDPRRAELRRFGLGFVVTGGVLLSLSVVAVGPQTWQEFATKIWQHNDSFSAWRVGFKHLFLGAYEYLPPEQGTHQEAFHARAIGWWTIQGIALAAFVVVTRGLKDWELFACGFVPTFLLVAPSYYFYIMLVLPLLFFAGRRRDPVGKVGLVVLFASSSAAYVLYDRVGRELPLFFALSCMLMAVCLLMCLSSAIRNPGRVPRRSEPVRASGGSILAGPRG